MKFTDYQEFNPTIIARRAVESYVLKNEVIKAPKSIPAEFKSRGGVFVSIKTGTALRGCIGTIKPQTENIAEEIIKNAISASTADPRFYPITSAEINDLIYSVDILLPEEPVSDIKQLDPKKYGVIVKAGGSLGLLLPNVEGVDSVKDQIAIASRKAMIPRYAALEIYRFEVKRYLEDNAG